MEQEDVVWRVLLAIGWFRIKRSFLMFTSVLALLALATGPAFAAGATKQSIPAQALGGITCGSTFYALVGGTFTFTSHQGTSASGNMNVTGTAVPNAVTLVSGGKAYGLQGAGWFGATYNAQTGTMQTTDTEKFTITQAGGGVVGTVNTVMHLSPNGQVTDFTFGACALPTG